MSYQLIWSPEAKEEFAQLLEYLELNHGLNVALSALDKVDNVLEKIVIFPSMYPLSPKKSIRKAVVTKELSLFYRVKGSSVELLHFFDNRRNPNDIDTWIP